MTDEQTTDEQSIAKERADLAAADEIDAVAGSIGPDDEPADEAPQPLTEPQPLPETEWRWMQIGITMSGLIQIQRGDITVLEQMQIAENLKASANQTAQEALVRERALQAERAKQG